MKRCPRLVTLVICFAAPGLSQAGVVRVPQDYLLIQQACDAAAPGDTILLGTLDDTMLVESVLLNGKRLVIRSKDGPQKTQLRRQLYIGSLGPADTTKIEGIRWKSGSGAPVLAFREGCYVVDNCVFDSSSYCSSPYGPYFTVGVGPNADVQVTRCTFVSQPRAVSSHYEYLGGNSTVRVSSCLFVRSCEYALFPNGGYLSAEYCCFWQNAEDADSSVDWGPGNMPFDPMLRRPDLSLQPGSPCIDAGDPDLPLDPDGSRADVGAYIPYRTAGILHVSTEGSDDEGDGTLGQPFRSVGMAYFLSVPRDTIMLLPGFYPEHLKLDRAQVLLTSSGGAEVTGLHDVVGDRPILDILAGTAGRSTISHLTIADALNASGLRVRRGARPRIEFCVLINHTAIDGGGLYIDSDSVLVYGCRFSYNSAARFGGGIYARNAEGVVIDSCEFHDNSSGDLGSAIMLDGVHHATLTRNLVRRNSCWDDVGGPICLRTSHQSVVRSNTVCQNIALDLDALGAGITVVSCSTIDLRNNLVSYNQGRYGIALAGPSSFVTNQYNNLVGQWSAGAFGVSAGAGCIEADPLLNQDFELQTGSPCIDAGDPSLPVPPGGGGRIDIGAFEYQQPVAVHDNEGDHRPDRFTLEPNHPNPFNASTQIAYVLPQAAHARLVIHDVLGRLVAVLVDNPQSAGRHVVPWEGKDTSNRPVGSGVYLISLESGGQSEVRKLLLLK